MRLVDQTKCSLISFRLMHNFYGKCNYKVECSVAIQHGYLCLLAPPSDSLLNIKKKLPLDTFLTDTYLCVRCNYESWLQCDSIMVDFVMSTIIVHRLKFYQVLLLSPCLSRNCVLESVDQIPNSLYMLIQCLCKHKVIIFPSLPFMWHRSFLGTSAVLH